MPTNSLIAKLNVPGRAPFIPILGAIAPVLAQISEECFVSDAQAQASAVNQVGTAFGVDGLTVGWRTEPTVTARTVERIRPLAADRAVIALLEGADVSGARVLLEAHVDALMLMDTDDVVGSRGRTIGNLARHYDVPVILVAPSRPDAALAAASLGLAGALVGQVRGDEPGIVGGGLESENPIAAPRGNDFFWSYPGEVPYGTDPELIVALGRQIAS